MPLQPASRLGAFELVERIGAGGMGEVWRARDPRLGRDVAIKLLPDKLSDDTERLSRFQREARLLASLNHPAIATVHGFERAEGVSFLVLELVEGRTLAERLRRGPLPVREALETGARIAEALAAAHGKGVVHRDLKPSNVKLLGDGRVKLLDFGLAKALGTEAPAGEVSPLTTEASATESGVILGTAPYMSPEQARGRPADERTDVWAFGCVLYEMLTGKRAFPGATASDVIAAVIGRDPDWTTLPTETPQLALSVLKRCLQKDPARRLHHITDARLEIEEAVAEPVAAGPGSRSWTRTVVLLVTLALAAGIGGSWLLIRKTTAARHTLTRFNIDLAPGTAFSTEASAGTLVVISPDGSQLIYSVRDKGLFLRPLDSTESRLLPGTEQAENPFFSPDGRWVGFAANRKLQKIELGGRSPRIIADIGGGSRGASWGEDGSIVYAPEGNSGLFRIASDGATPQRLTRPDGRGELSHRWPQILPGGQDVLFTVRPLSGRPDESRIEVVSLATGARTVVVQGATQGRYVPTGHLVFSSGGSLFAAPFDLSGMRQTGPAVAVIEDVLTSEWGTGAVQFDVSQTGTAVYVSPRARPRAAALLWVDRNGSAVTVSPMRRAFRGPRVSPDGRRLVVAIEEQDASSLWLLDIGRQAWSRLTSEKDSWAPVWSPDGRRIAFSSNREGSRNLFWLPAEGGRAEQLTASANWQYPSEWSRDGKHLFFSDSVPNMNISEVALDGERHVRPVLATPFDEWNAAASPDGRWLAYESHDSGRWEVYIRPYGGSGARWPLSTDGGSWPRWSPTGGEVFHLRGTKVVAVPVTAGPDFKVGSPKVLFDRGRNLFGYDVAPDGQRFVIAEDAETEPERSQIVAIPAWFEELKARMGGR